ncbi:chloride channel protein [Trichloromonas sp.]|uniref:chloride channel protein n=1 Tax=Trichloromonas sp. TaxID=3069249 RepID=UPI003D814259
MSQRWRFGNYRENLIALLLIAILIGVATGFLAVGFRYLLLYASAFCWNDPFDIVGAATSIPWYVIVATPVIGGLLVGPVIAFWAPETRGAGVPEVIEAVVAHEGRIRHRTTLFKLATTVVSIGSGASVGREGPIVHMGSSVGSSIAQWIRLSHEWRRVFLACGAAAGIAATFNAPMAGMLFAAEIILVDFQVSYLSHIAISSVTATVISHHFLGSLPAFEIPYFELVSYWEIPLYGLLGILAGLLAVAFIKSVGKVEDGFAFCRVPVWLRPAIGGFMVGLIAIDFPHVLGVGYETINLMLSAQTAVGLLLILLVLKLAATSFSVGAGFSGGIFAPSLVLGGLLGGLFGSGMHALWPEMTAAYPAYGLVGMGALVAGTTLAPITAIFTIFELTYNFDIILPVMTSSIASLITVQTVYGYSIYETKLIKKGIRMIRGHDVTLLRSMLVRDYMDGDFEWVREDTLLGKLIAKAQDSPYPHFPVLNNRDELVGMVSLRDLKEVLAEMGDLCELVVASEIMTRDIFTISTHDNFETAFEVFEGRSFSTLPVVDHRRPYRVVGLLKKSNLLLAYNQKVLKMDAFSRVS